MKLLLILLLSSQSFAYMSHNEIVRQMRGQEELKPSKRTKSGKSVYYDKIDNVILHKKKKKSKKQKQGAAIKRFFGGGGSTPSPTPTSTPTSTPAITPSPTASPGTLPGSGVDHRSDCATSVKSQGATPRCTAFGGAAALESLACDHVDLSSANIWSLYGVSYSDSLMKYLPGNYITTWEKWPQSNSRPNAGYLEEAKTRTLHIDYIDGKTVEDDVIQARAALDRGERLMIGLSVPSDMASCYSVVRGTSAVTRGGHHVDIEGYQVDASLKMGLYFIIKNSWGEDCADKGYQYLDPSFCTKNGAYCYFYRMSGLEKKK